MHNTNSVAHSWFPPNSKSTALPNSLSFLLGSFITCSTSFVLSFTCLFITPTIMQFTLQLFLYPAFFLFALSNLNIYSVRHWLLSFSFALVLDHNHLPYYFLCTTESTSISFKSSIFLSPLYKIQNYFWQIMLVVTSNNQQILPAHLFSSNNLLLNAALNAAYTADFCCLTHAECSLVFTKAIRFNVISSSPPLLLPCSYDEELLTVVTFVGNFFERRFCHIARWLTSIARWLTSNGSSSWSLKSWTSHNAKTCSCPFTNLLNTQCQQIFIPNMSVSMHCNWYDLSAFRPLPKLDMMM